MLRLLLKHQRTVENEVNVRYGIEVVRDVKSANRRKGADRSPVWLMSQYSECIQTCTQFC